MFATFSARLSDSLAATDIAPETRSELLASANDLAGMRLPEGMPEDAATEARTAINESFTAGYSRILAAMAVVAVLGGVLALVTLPGRNSTAGG